MSGRHDTGISREDARDVRVDLAKVGFEGGGQCHGGRVGAPSPESGDIPFIRDPLEAGHNRDHALGERLAKAVALHLEDPCLGVHRVGDDARLATCE